MKSLSQIDTRPPDDLDKDATKEETKALLEELDEMQNMLYAQQKHSVLVVFQGMDASGKDGAIRNVFGRLNPQGISVQSFKVPTEEEKAHDFLWRIHKHTPQKGQIQIFNRSHYEDVLVTRVHGWIDDAEAERRIRAINDFERLLQVHNNTHLLKFYLHVSEKEQAKRLEERKSDPRKMWKHNDNDAKEAALREKYQQLYDEIFEQCNKPKWHIIPADKNWYKEHLVAKALRNLLQGLDMSYPKLDT